MFNDFFSQESYRLRYNAEKSDTDGQTKCQYNTGHAPYMVVN